MVVSIYTDLKCITAILIMIDLFQNGVTGNVLYR